jgi:hypothetical protein
MNVHSSCLQFMTPFCHVLSIHNVSP